MRNLEHLAISAIAFLVALSCLGACGKDSSLHPGASGGAGGGGGLRVDGGSLGDGGAGVAGQGAGGNGTGGAFPGTGGNPNFGTGGNPNFGIGGNPNFGTGGTGIGGRPGIGGFPGTGGSFSGVGGFINGAGGSSAGCAQAATQTACDANPSCYSVFIDPHDCACAPIGCCARFHHCAEGARGAQCYGGVSCALASPFCEGPYVVSYRNDCFEGCVNSMDCAPACTPGADQTCNDNPIVSALHGHCTATGTCQCASTYVLNPNTGRCL